MATMNSSPFGSPARTAGRLAALGRQLGRALALRPRKWPRSWPRSWPRRRRAGAQDAHLAWIDSLECEANAMTPAPTPGGRSWR